MAVPDILRPILGFHLYRFIFRPFLFLLSPESAQALAGFALKIRPLWQFHRIITRVDSKSLTTPMGGFEVSNPIGLAAGFDKNLEFLNSLADMGFGYLVCGTITLEPRNGNPKPRLLRNVKRNSLINSLGFPGQGLNSAVSRLTAYTHSGYVTPVIVSIAALNEQDTLYCHETLQPMCSAIELNISSPNTEGVRVYQSKNNLKHLLEKLNDSRSKPLFVKLPPWTDDDSREQVLSLVKTCKEAGVTGVTAFNSLPVNCPDLAIGKGGLSGKPLFEDLVDSLPLIRSELGPKAIINACGGISSSNDVIAALNAGANSVQIYTSIIFQGPGLVNSIIHDLDIYLTEAKNG